MRRETTCMIVLAALLVALPKHVRPQGPTLVTLGTKTLHEPRGFELAKPLNAVIDASGRLYVADAFNQAVLHYDSSGRAERWLGRLITGSGDLAGLGGILGVDDRSIFVYDYAALDVIEIGLRDGRVLSRTPYSGRLVGGTLRNDTLWLALLDFERGLSMAYRSRDELGAGRPKIAPQHVPLAASYGSSSQLAGVFDLVHLASTPSTLVQVYSGTSELAIWEPGTQAVARARIPAWGRARVDSAMWRQLKENRVPFAELIAGVAPASFIHATRPDLIVVVHMGLVRASERTEATSLWVSLVSADGERTCGDTRITLAGGSQPAIAARGDTLFVVQRVTAATGAHTAVSRYRVSPTGCRWVRTEAPVE